MTIERVGTRIPTAVLLVLLACLACAEPSSSRPVAVAPAPESVAAQLLVSDSYPPAGSNLSVFVRVSGALSGSVASFTARLQYDTTGLRYLGEAAMADSATRVTNPLAGLLRSAGVSRKGFAAGLLVGYRFAVVRPDAVATLKLTFDELHTTAHTDLKTTLTVASRPVVQP